MLLSPADCGGITLRNRIIFAPTTMGLGKDALLERIGRIADGGAALVIIGDVPVTKSRFVPSLETRRGFALYSALTERIHRGGALASAQLHEDDTVMKGMMKYMLRLITGKMSMEDMRTVENGLISDMITNKSDEEVEATTEAFASAAALALDAGFDMVQIHGDRMCGAFSSSLFNRRTDRWGGSVEKRALFAAESVRAVRKRFPSLPIDYKLCFREEEPHYGNAGITAAEAEIFVPILEEAGVTSFHVTLADHSSLEDTIPPKSHPYYSEEGCFLKFADVVKKYTTLPVAGVGGLGDPGFIERGMEEGRIDFAAMSRQLIADPEWPKKLKEGREEEIRRCTRCNKACLGGLMHHKGVSCIYDEKRK